MPPKQAINLDFFEIPGFYTHESEGTGSANEPYDPASTNVQATIGHLVHDTQAIRTSANDNMLPDSWCNAPAYVRPSTESGTDTRYFHSVGIPYSPGGPTQQAWTLSPTARGRSRNYTSGSCPGAYPTPSTGSLSVSRIQISRYPAPGVTRIPTVGLIGSTEDRIAFSQWQSFAFPAEGKLLPSCLAMDYLSGFDWLTDWQEKLRNVARYMKGEMQYRPHTILVETIAGAVPCERVWLWRDCFLAGPSSEWEAETGRYRLFVFEEDQRKLRVVETVTFPLTSQDIADLSGDIGLQLRN